MNFRLCSRSWIRLYNGRVSKKPNRICFIPRGAKRYLQPLDIGINIIFKQKLKEYYLSYQVENSLSSTGKKFKVDKEYFIKWISSNS